MNETSKIQDDLEEIVKIAFNGGATSAKSIDPKQVVVDDRVRIKCQIPICFSYGQRRMCPPFTFTPKEFREYLSKYTNAVAVQVVTDYPKELKATVSSHGAELAEIAKEGDFLKPIDSTWRKLHKVVKSVETEAFKRGYYFSFGLGFGFCRLCEKCDLASPCKHPFEARPSMEAVGIDVVSTTKNIGLGVEFSPRDKIIVTGLVLIG
jgi:predicted metal-binding protein